MLPDSFRFRVEKSAVNQWDSRNKITYFSLNNGSTPTVGSSRIKSLGSCNKAHIIETRRLCPPLKKKKKYSNFI